VSLTVLDGSTFCVCEEAGDIDGKATASGFFVADTRFLSRSVLRIAGARPPLLSSSQPAPHRARFVSRNPDAGGLQPNELSIDRERFVGDHMQERIRVECHGRRRVETELTLELEADFADIFLVKELEPGFDVPVTVQLPEPGRPRWDAVQRLLVLADEASGVRTMVQLSQPCTLDGSVLRFPIALEHGEAWTLTVGVQALLEGAIPLVDGALPRAIEAERREAEESLVRWRATAPTLEGSLDDLRHTWTHSVNDIAALRMRVADLDLGRLPAAGTPWFMTVFGRDTSIVCLQTMLFGPELATGTLRVLAALQSSEDDAERDAEPGKIIHELRRGKAAEHWTDRYYGTVDATPLFLILLSELWRWTGDPQLARELEDNARRALDWIDGPGDRDGDGFVEYLRRASHGLRNQSWKDSEDSMVFRDGLLADGPIAPVEIQGYVYDAKLRIAELAREVWGDHDLAARLERDAHALRERFNEAFWVADGGFYALGLDGAKRQIDAVASNMGHLLWSGIVPAERIEAVADRLMGPGLWSGWGVRTLADGELGYNPLVYHNGTVWPHDNSLIAWGLAHAGRTHDAELIVQRSIEAAAHFDHRLPEVFAGFDRDRSGIPVAYPTASRPQAWAAATPVLLLRVLLGIEPDRAAGVLTASARELPGWAEGLTLGGVRALGRTWTVRVVDGAATVEPD
jgi:glycogen debranching enzyme